MPAAAQRVYDRVMLLATGDEFAGYRIQRLLGSDGTGEVYLAQHPRLPRFDALKILPAHLATDIRYRQRFEREADLAATLSHPHIVAVHDRGEERGRLWISMDFVDGTDAARLLRESGPIPVPAVLDIVDAVADALDYAHERGLLHRDVKPANILLSTPQHGPRRILLSDFGVARRADEVSGLTSTNSVSYASPEQLTGQQVDRRSDQYSLALTAYELLCGTKPFDGSNAATVIAQQLNAAPPRIGGVRPDLAAADPVFTRALAKHPDGWFATCGEFAVALRSSLTGTAPAPVVTGAPAAAPMAPPATVPPTFGYAEPAGLAPPYPPFPTSPTVAGYPHPVGSAPPYPAPTPMKRSRSGVVGIAVPAILAVLLAVAITFAVAVPGRSGPAPAAAEPDWEPYVAAAKTVAEAIYTSDYRTVDQDYQRILDITTGPLHDDFKEHADVVIDGTRSLESVSSATAVGAGLEKLGTDRADVIVAVKVQTGRASWRDPFPDVERLRLTIERVGDEYKASRMQEVR
jgi:serine/threonine-protein kinase